MQRPDMSSIRHIAAFRLQCDLEYEWVFAARELTRNQLSSCGFRHFHSKATPAGELAGAAEAARPPGIERGIRCSFSGC